MDRPEVARRGVVVTCWWPGALRANAGEASRRAPGRGSAVDTASSCTVLIVMTAPPGDLNGWFDPRPATWRFRRPAARGRSSGTPSPATLMVSAQNGQTLVASGSRRDGGRTRAARARRAAAAFCMLSISSFIRAASVLVCPWQTIGSEPPLVSMMTFENITPVSIVTEATWLLWIDCSSRPNHCGLYWVTAGRADSHLGREDPVAARQPAGDEHVAVAEGAALEQNGAEQREHDQDRGDRRVEHPRRRGALGHHRFSR